MNKTFLVLFSVMLVGCKTLAHGELTSDQRAFLITEARESLAKGEYFRARQLTEEILASASEDKEAQQLMAEILNEEISNHKEILETQVPEDFSPDEKLETAREWLERAEMYAALGEYEAALEATEKVFTYDPGSVQASELVDDIRKRAKEERKVDSLTLQKMYSDEVEERVRKYKEQTHEWIRTGRWGAAKLTIEKALLLAPEDEQALQLYEEIQSHREVKAA